MIAVLADGILVGFHSCQLVLVSWLPKAAHRGIVSEALLWKTFSLLSLDRYRTKVYSDYR